MEQQSFAEKKKTAAEEISKNIVIRSTKKL